MRPNWAALRPKVANAGYGEGDVIVREGDAGSAFFIVLDGAACVSIDGVIVRTVGDG